jgi:transcriptional regulator with XRE-family HTH domain
MFEPAGIAVMPEAKANSLAESMISADQCRAARALLGWAREDLAKAAGVSAGTIKNVELGKGTLGVVAVAVERALTDAGIEFIHEDDSSGEGVRWRKPKRQRRA